MNTRPNTATDLAWFIHRESKWSRPTKADYVRSVKRLPDLMGRTRLEDVIIDLDDLEARFPLDGFDPAHFASQNAYRAWRRKIMASVKAFAGQARPRRYDDEWSALNLSVEVFTLDHPDFRVSAVRSLSAIAAAARKQGTVPRDLNNAAIARLSEDIPYKKHKEILKGVHLLNRLRDTATSLRPLLPPSHLEIPDRTRGKLPAPPDHLAQELETWITSYCAGDIDEITEDVIEGKSSSAAYTYRAAGRKYLGFAGQLGLLAGIPNLALAFSDEIAKPTLRVMLKDRESPTSISLRSARSYLDNLLRLARSQGHEAPLIARALASNRELKSGQRDAHQMSSKAKRFCALLLADRRAEMKYRSLHLRMRALHDELASRAKSGERIPYLSDRLRQVASLAAMSAIWVWGPPLRIGNMCELRLYGDAPQIWLPSGKTKDIRITIELDEAKNKRAIHQRIAPGRHRAIETIEWYVNEIRPGLPGAGESIWMFPATHAATKPILTSTVRNWVERYSGEVGLPMKPHLFRHAAASLYIRSHPGAYDHVAQLLDDTPQVVRRFYAWIDDMAVMDEVQSHVLQHAGFDGV